MGKDDSRLFLFYTCLVIQFGTYCRITLIITSLFCYDSAAYEKPFYTSTLLAASSAWLSKLILLWSFTYLLGISKVEGFSESYVQEII